MTSVYAGISKYKTILSKGYTPNCSEEVFVIKEIKNTVPWTYVINGLNGEEIIGTFYENELKRLKRLNIMLRSKILNIKCLILLT